MPKMLWSRAPTFPADAAACMAALMVSVVFPMLLLGRRCEAKIKLPPGVVVEGVIVFGDSIVDQGMNNNLQTFARCNYPPYGQDFAGEMPTGRFCNGKTPSDFIAEELGVKELLPAYFDPNLQPEDYKTGVSFASGGCGFDPLTAQIATAIPLSTQLNYFKEYKGKLKEMVGENQTNYIIENTLFVVVAGTNDVLNTYFSLPIRRYKYDINAYADLMIQGAADFIQELYDLGARRAVIFGIPPAGCVPSQRTLAGGKSRACVEEYNEASQIVNSKLSAEIDSLNNKLPQSTIVYVDIYNPLLDLIQNPQNYGFEVADRGCCGTGVIEVTFLCNKYTGTCPDHNKYVFWDSFHPTERAYGILVHQILQKYVYRFA
ncbi:PREDICTED: GDSL esterase/lipase EXL3-like [Ipomoea nil]|uniref:GDSL esterase/lipase EXL3-like n=1 Tax=Ipomoea nil TaxID=35883 RepID=UPI0009015B67|nr:PREDICTED: GDSL esterase/lipase EXL3-like [Ipomoea nil]